MYVPFQALEAGNAMGRDDDDDDDAACRSAAAKGLQAEREGKDSRSTCETAASRPMAAPSRP